MPLTPPEIPTVDWLHSGKTYDITWLRTRDSDGGAVVATHRIQFKQLFLCNHKLYIRAMNGHNHGVLGITAMEIIDA